MTVEVLESSTRFRTLGPGPMSNDHHTNRSIRAAALRAFAFAFGLVASLAASSAALLSAEERSSGQLLVEVGNPALGSAAESARWDGILTFARLLASTRQDALAVRFFDEGDALEIAHEVVDDVYVGRLQALARPPRSPAKRRDPVPSLAMAATELRERPGTRYVVIVGSESSSGDRRLRYLTERCERGAVRVFFVALVSDGSRRSRSGQDLAVACERTGGKAYTVDTREIPTQSGILEVFLDIFTRVAPPSLVVLTDPQGRFAIHRSHRYFAAIDPRGRRLALSAPNGERLETCSVLEGREVAFARWNLLSARRPGLAYIDDVWESSAWTLSDALTGQPVSDAHVYVHGDVTFAGPSQRFSITEGKDPVLSLRLRASDLPQWVANADVESFQGSVEVLAEVFALDAAVDLSLATTRLYADGDGVFRGTIPARLERGVYRLSLVANDARERQLENRAPLAQQLGSELVVRPPYCRMLVLRETGDGTAVVLRAEGANVEYVEPVFEGDRLRFEVGIDPRRAFGDPESTSFAVDSVRWRLSAPGATVPREVSLTRRAPAGSEIEFASDWVDVEAAGAFSGSVDVEATLRRIDSTSAIGERREASAGASLPPASRVERFLDSLPAPAFASRAVGFRVEWERLPTVLASDEIFSWSGRLLVAEGPRHRVTAMLAAVLAAGPSVALAHDDEVFDSHDDSPSFAATAWDMAGDGIAFSGRFGGTKGPGTWTVAVRVPHQGRDAAIVEDGRRSLRVEARRFDVTLLEMRAGERRVVARSGVAARAELFADRLFALEITPSLAPASERPPDVGRDVEVDLITNGTTRRLEVHETPDRQATDSLALPVGEHRFRVALGFASDSRALHELDVVVVAPPSPSVRLVAPAKTPWVRHELVPLAVEAIFTNGGHDDWTHWTRDWTVTGRLLRSGLDDAIATTELVADDVPGAPVRFGARLPTAVHGDFRLVVEVRRGEELLLPPLESAVRIVDLLDVRVHQRDAVLASTLHLATAAGRTDRALLVSLDPLDPRGPPGPLDPLDPLDPLAFSGVTVERSRIAVLRDDELLAEVDVEGPPAAQVVLDAGSSEGDCVVRVECELRADGAAELRHFAWTSPSIHIAWVEPSRLETVLQIAAALAVLALVLVVVLRRDSKLPLLHARITWFAPEFRTEEIAIRSSWIARFRSLGKRKRRLRVGAGGDVTFGVDPLDLGLGRNAHVDFELVAGRADDGTEQVFLRVFGHNVGGRVPIEINGHLRARIIGQHEVRVPLRSLRSVRLGVQASRLRLQVHIYLVDSESNRRTTASEASR